MSPLLENIVVSVITGLMAAASMLQTAPVTSTRDWVTIAATGVVAFGGSFINGQRQLHKDPAQ